MKHGPFILITESAEVLAEKLPGVVAPDGLSLVWVDNLKAIILDEALDLETRRSLQRTCLEAGVPCFSAPLDPSTDPLQNGDPRENLLQFVREQNAWRNETPSAETIERIHMKTLVDIITTANSLLQPEEVMQTVMQHIHELIPCEAWSVLILDNNEESTLSFAVSFGPGKDSLLNLKVPFGKGIAGWVAQNRKPVIVQNAQNDPRFFSKIDKDTQFVTRNILCAPLVSRGRTIGVIEMINGYGPEGFLEKDLELIQVLVNPAAVAIENAFLFQKAQRLAIVDDLTRLYNLRHLNHCLEMELKKADREGGSLSLVFLDLDGFKRVNDSYGHLVGSGVLVDIAQIILGCVGPDDIVGRYGGDEFMIILPNCDRDKALSRAQAILEQVSSYEIRELRLSASLGIAVYPESTDEKEQLVRLADQAMYRVKESGKNGIRFAPASHGNPT